MSVPIPEIPPETPQETSSSIQPLETDPSPIRMNIPPNKHPNISIGELLSDETLFMGTMWEKLVVVRS